MSTPVVEITAGDVALGGRPILRGIDVSVQAGEWVVISLFVRRAERTRRAPPRRIDWRRMIWIARTR